jgi:hypothetical protein
MMARIREWRFDSGEFISVAEVDLAEGVALQPHALSGASGISNDRFLSVYPIAPGSMIEVVFQSTAETRFRVEKDLEALDAQVRDGEVGEEVANRVRERCQRAMKKLKQFEAVCMLEDLPRCHAVEARLKQLPSREWLELVEAGADTWIERELPNPAAWLFETGAAAGVDAEQYFWRAAALYAAGGMQGRARAALARFRAAAAPEQLAEAAEAIRDLEREIEALGSESPTATRDSK